MWHTHVAPLTAQQLAGGAVRLDVGGAIVAMQLLLVVHVFDVVGVVEHASLQLPEQAILFLLHHAVLLLHVGGQMDAVQLAVQEPAVLRGLSILAVDDASIQRLHGGMIPLLALYRAVQPPAQHLWSASLAVHLPVAPPPLVLVGLAPVAHRRNGLYLARLTVHRHVELPVGQAPRDHHRRELDACDADRERLRVLVQQLNVRARKVPFGAALRILPQSVSAKVRNGHRQLDPRGRTRASDPLPHLQRQSWQVVVALRNSDRFG
mmetsp:Transcript_52634/g.132379  ORF Transcript_52634/g.132379 Transcript_52634/m.132379 type:complete len:264 (-) Transcript_52634:834-1625(-)